MRILFAALLFGIASPPQDTGVTPRQAIGLVRSINTVQAETRFKAGVYLSLDRLLQETRLAKLPGPPITPVEATSATFGDYKVSVIASPDGAHYTVSVISTVACGDSYFSNDAAVIYPAKALGCKAE